MAIRFLHLPLPMHPLAKGAAIGMQAAQRQGKGWELHDVMFENRQALTNTDLARYAGDLGLDVEKFKKDLEDPEVKKQVDADMAAAKGADVSGAPAFFINGRRLTGARPYADFKAVIDEELKAANELLEKGTPIEKIHETRAKAQKKSG